MNSGSSASAAPGLELAPLSAPAAKWTERFGAKGARLAALYQAGMPVPPALLVASSALASLLASDEARGALVRLREASQPRSESLLHECSRALTGAVMAATFPPHLMDAMGLALEELGPLAVRSSSCREDGFCQSGAGQHDTVLGVADLAAMAMACKRVVASQFSVHALHYFTARVSPQGDMAVILQRMVPARASGVLFTRDPVTGDEDVMVLEACFGLGTLVVQGSAVAERTYVRRGSVEIVDQQLRAQLYMECYDATTGSVSLLKAAPSVPTRVLSYTDVITLVELAGAVEDYLGVPLDIEWSFAGDDLFLLQARPITALRGLAT